MCTGELEKLYESDRLDVREAFRIQEALSERIIKGNCLRKITTVAGADLAILGKGKGLVCGIAVFSYPKMELIEKKWTVVAEKFPYIPTLLAFREGPAVLSAYRKLDNVPDLLILDGHGLAHPRRLGIACHVGVLLDTATMGIAKKRLFGDYREPGLKRGSVETLTDPKNGEVMGAVVRTRDNVKPVFVSTGNRIDLDTAIEVTLACHSGYRIPEPTRKADSYVAELKKEIATYG